MSQQPPDQAVPRGEGEDSDLNADEYGGLTVEDDPGGTVDPAELAGTAKPSDAEVGYEPEFSEADDDAP
ncbi:MAG: hypothetical protein H0T91_00690 [Propionibacteriaceae bacterium]|nr:hypothetical protein [Propionibacteriaceae bacterium]